MYYLEHTLQQYISKRVEYNLKFKAYLWLWNRILLIVILITGFLALAFRHLIISLTMSSIKLNLDNRSLAIVHSKNAYNKIKKFDIDWILYDDLAFTLNKKDGEIAFSNLVVGNYIRYLEGLIKVLRTQYKQSLLQLKYGRLTPLDILGLKRLTFSLLSVCDYRIKLELVCDLVKDNSVIYTAEKESRFAVAEIEVMRGKMFNWICLPHGLSYNLNFTHGMPGKVYYTLSRNECNVLRKIYNTNKFIFDAKVADKLLEKAELSSVTRNILVCTSSRDEEAELNLCRYLNEKGFKFDLKLHPNEREGVFQDFRRNIIQKINCQYHYVLAVNSTMLLSMKNNNNQCLNILFSKDALKRSRLLPALECNAIKKITHHNDLDDILNESNHTKPERW